MNFNEAYQAAKDAEDTIEKTDLLVKRLSKLMVGRLRLIPKHIAADLKKELKDFNAKEYTWK